MEPRDIFVRTTPPLTATFKKCERECAAALLVVACQDAEEWRACTPHDLGMAIKAHAGEKGYEWFDNPYISPDFYGLLADGYISGDIGNGGALEFTQKGLDALKASTWYRCSVTRPVDTREFSR